MIMRQPLHRLAEGMNRQVLARLRACIPGRSQLGIPAAAGLCAAWLCIGAAPLANPPFAAADERRTIGASVFPATAEITTASPMLDAVIQNTPGYSEGYAAGVPRTYDWCAGSYRPPDYSAPPGDFTAVAGWGQIYANAEEDPYSNPSATIEIARAGTYVRLKAARRWVPIQDQTANPITGAYFAPDFAPGGVIPLQIQRLPDGTAVIGPPPADRNAHFWMAARGRYPAGSIDGAYVQMDIRVSDPKINLIANVGVDWWRDATAALTRDFSNNPAAGMSNWVRLSTEWTTLRFYSVTTSELTASPPPPLAARAGDTRFSVTRRRATKEGRCLSRSYHPLPRDLVPPSGSGSTSGSR